MDYPKDCYRIHIVADNCCDNTVAISTELGVKVLQRIEPANAGNGHALVLDLKQVNLDQYDAKDPLPVYV